MSFKLLKKDLDAVFTSILGRAQQGEMPGEEDISLFMRLLVQLQNVAAEEWAYECDDFVHLAKELLQAVRQGDQQDAILLVESLDDAKAYCHRTFKD